MDHRKIVRGSPDVVLENNSIIILPSSSAWFFYKIMNVSGAEAVVAAASPWVGQGESACLVRPYVDRAFPL